MCWTEIAAGRLLEQWKASFQELLQGEYSSLGQFVEPKRRQQFDVSRERSVEETPVRHSEVEGNNTELAAVESVEKAVATVVLSKRAEAPLVELVEVLVMRALDY